MRRKRPDTTKGDDGDDDREKIGRQCRSGRRRVGVRENRDRAHRSVVHPRDRDPERGSGQKKRRPSDGSGRQSQRETGCGDRYRDAGDDEPRRMRHVRARVQRRHADVVHRRDAEAHEDRRRDQAIEGQRLEADGDDGDADNEDADKKRQEGRKGEIVDRKRKARGQHGNEMHRPDGDGERQRRRRKQATAGAHRTPSRPERQGSSPTKAPWIATTSESATSHGSCVTGMTSRPPPETAFAPEPSLE